MKLIAKIQDKESTIEIYPKEKSKTNLLNIYKVIGDISQNPDYNTTSWFYTKEELKALKKKSHNIYK